MYIYIYKLKLTPARLCQTSERRGSSPVSILSNRATRSGERERETFGLVSPFGRRVLAEKPFAQIAAVPQSVLLLLVLLLLLLPSVPQPEAAFEGDTWPPKYLFPFN